MSGTEVKKKIRELKLSSLPLDEMRELRPAGLQGGARWTGDDNADRRALLYEIEGYYNPQTVGFTVDILPYFFEILRADDSRHRVEAPLSVLDVGSRTGVGANLIAQIFYGIWARRRISVDVVDINPAFGAYIEATQPYIRRFLCSDIADLESNSYDYVICSHVLEHVNNPSEFCNNLRRITKKRVVVYCPYEEHDPIIGHNTISESLLEVLGAQDKIISDKSWFWKRSDRPNQKTVIFWLSGGCNASSKPLMF